MYIARKIFGPSYFVKALILALEETIKKVGAFEATLFVPARKSIFSCLYISYAKNKVALKIETSLIALSNLHST